MGGENDHGEMRGHRQRKPKPVGDLLGDLVNNCAALGLEQQLPAGHPGSGVRDSSGTNKAPRGYVKIPREILGAQKSRNRIRRISAAIEIHLRKNVRWGRYVEHFRGPYGKPNKTMTHAGEVFVNISKIMDSTSAR